MSKSIHYISGITLAIFIGLHLFNHLYSILGAKEHIEMMNLLRCFYRNIFVESILLVSVFTQIVSGLKLIRERRKIATTAFEKLQIGTGLYLAVFLTIHLTAVFSGRFLFNLDTNFYFGVAGLNTFPMSIFFIPYYGLAIISFFGHLASIHSRKMRRPIAGVSPHQQAIFIFIIGFILTIVTFYGLTNHFKGYSIPKPYNVLTGKTAN